jgi:hypothetical protein
MIVGINSIIKTVLAFPYESSAINRLKRNTPFENTGFAIMPIRFRDCYERFKCR